MVPSRHSLHNPPPPGNIDSLSGFDISSLHQVANMTKDLDPAELAEAFIPHLRA